MKKLFFPMITLAIMIASCGESDTKTESKASESSATETTATPAPSEPASAPAVNSDTPKFSSPEVQKLADDYAAYIKETTDAAKSGDASKMQAIATKAQEWTTKTQEAAAKMTPEDAKLWAEYVQKLATQMAGN